ncbi:nickel-dependent lactate racemase [Desulfobacula sp.]|uniref:nickel-dependent lactate racemase n=1 Tax=Desulfobacula sp. TaxID=2593537 RepID=UPI002614A2E7|nr:nickel-dependent lactate racemase [Desulfobacula sp.]
MHKKTEFKYGKAFWDIELPDKTDSLSIREPVSFIDRKKFVTDFSKALPEDLPNCHAISIVVADKTRLCGYKTYLPWILEILRLKGIENRQITFFIAYGTHARQSDEECLNIYGNIYQRYRFIHHDSNDKSLFTHLGKTKRGTRVHLRKDILKSDLIITFGALSHHYFAGYGGGRKLMFPGLGYTPDIYQNHGLFLDKNLKKLSAESRPGNLENNPLAQDLKQVDDFIEIQRVSIHGILDSKGKVCQLIVGKTYNDFLTACKTLDSFYKTRTKKQYELVLASCGGFPKDINFIQAHKAINNAAMVVKDKGSLVVLAECLDGIGSDTFIKYFNYGSFNQAFNVLEKDYKGNGGTALSMMAKTSRINIFLKTALDDKICKTIGVKKVEETLIQTLIKEFQHDMACIENASLLIR